LSEQRLENWRSWLSEEKLVDDNELVKLEKLVE
jgi:hypothetical protein